MVDQNVRASTSKQYSNRCSPCMIPHQGAVLRTYEELRSEFSAIETFLRTVVVPTNRNPIDAIPFSNAAVPNKPVEIYPGPHHLRNAPLPDRVVSNGSTFGTLGIRSTSCWKTPSFQKP